MGSLGKFFLRRLVSVVAVVVFVTAITWGVLHLLRPEVYADDPRNTFVQLGDYLVRAFLHLDLGRSWERPQPAVATVMRQGFPQDVSLLAGGLLFGLLGGLAAGAYCASRPRSHISRAIEGTAMVLMCAPVYVVGLSLLLLFGAGIAIAHFGFIPLKYVPFSDSPTGWLGSLIVPWIVLGLPLAGACTRLMNGSMIEILDEEFMRTAYAKGLAHRVAIRRHAVPAAAAPVVTLAGVSVPILLTNMVLVELTFSVPGVYLGVRTSMEKADFPIIQGTVIVTAILVAVATLVVDLVLAWLDPLMRARATS